MCAKNTNIYVWCEQAIIREIVTHDLYCCLLPRCKALRICRSGFPIATLLKLNKTMLWPRCGGRAEFSLHTKNVRSVWFVVKRRRCCCNLPGGVALIVWFTTNDMCATNKNIYAWCEQAIIREIATYDLYSCLLPQCEAMRTCRSGFPIATLLKLNVICEQRWIQFELQHSPSRVFAFDGKIYTAI